jgi:hypothetical protein
MKFYLSLLIVVLFIGNYQICEFIYPDDLDKWWALKQNIYNVIIALCLYISQSSTDSKYVKFILDIGLVFALSNCIDRIFFDINYFQTNDIISIIISIAFSIKKYYNGTR